MKWQVKDSAGALWGPGPNRFSGDNVTVDAQGRLHMVIKKLGTGKYSCSEIIGPTSLGYGTYRWKIVNPVANFDPAVVVGMFTWSDQPAYANREIDIEVSRWLVPGAKQLYYTVNPYAPSRQYQKLFDDSTAAGTIHQLTWRSNSIAFQSSKLNASGQPSTIAAWTFSGRNVPQKGDERPRINLWLVQGKSPQSPAPIEVIFERFEFVPAL